MVNRTLFPKKCNGTCSRFLCVDQTLFKELTSAFGRSSEMHTSFDSVLIGIMHAMSCREGRQLINIVASLDWRSVPWLVRLWYFSVIPLVYVTGIKPRCIYFW